MSGTQGSLRITGHGFAVLPAVVDLQPTASGTWVDTGLAVVLPAAGVYRLDANIRGRLQASGADVNVWISGRLRDDAAGVVPGSAVIVTQLIIREPDQAGSGGNQQAPILVEYAVPGPRTVRVEAARFNSVGATTATTIHTDGHGQTTLRHVRVA